MEVEKKELDGAVPYGQSLLAGEALAIVRLLAVMTKANLDYFLQTTPFDIPKRLYKILADCPKCSAEAVAYWSEGSNQAVFVCGECKHSWPWDGVAVIEAIWGFEEE